MKIKINGKDEDFQDEEPSVSNLLIAMKVKMPEMVSVELNNKILDRKTFETTVVRDGDVVEFLYFMGGGMFNYGRKR